MRKTLALLALLATPAAAQVCAPAGLPAVNACAGGRVRVALVGDVLIHQALAVRGYARGFDTLWGRAVPLLRSADLAIANLEGPVAPGLTAGGRRLADPGPVFDGLVHSDYPRFNYHPVLVEALRQAGIDVVTTANNHILDRGPEGVEATLDSLGAGRLAQVGAARRGAPRWQALHLRTPAGRLALVACTFSTNGIADPFRQIPRCFDDRGALVALVGAEAASGAGVMVLPHWGQEYATAPDVRQRRLARELVAAGAMAVVGTHPHVPQPWEMLDGPAGRVPVVYSTGNFVAAQPPLERATAPLVWLDLCAGPRGPRVAGAGYTALQMEFDGADPSLTLPRLGDGPRAEAGLALLARLIPGREAPANCRPAPVLTPNR